MDKDKYNEGVELANDIVDQYVDFHRPGIDQDKAVYACQFIIDLHDWLEVTGLIHKLFPKKEK